MAKKQQEIKVVVEYSEGYQKRWTEAALKVYERRNKKTTMVPLQPPKAQAV